MKKLAAIIAIALIALTLTACSSEKPSTDPLVAKWAAKYDDDRSQVLFNFEAIGDLDVVVWHYDDEQQTYVQAEDYAGSYTVDRENATITYVAKDVGTFVFSYVLEDKVQLTLTYEDKTFTLPYIETNNA